METYLKEYHYEDITDLLNDINYNTHVSIMLDLTTLQQYNIEFFNNILKNTYAECEKWNLALLEVQKCMMEGGNIFLDPNFQIKENCHVRFINLPADLSLKQSFPSNSDINKFIQIKGTVIRMSQPKILEYKKEYMCRHCKTSKTIEGEFVKMFIIEPPKKCEQMCKGVPYQKTEQLQIKNCKDFQEIRIQEINSDKNVPAVLSITLENDLVDTCQPGDCITVCGTIERQWKPQQIGIRSDVLITMRAISVIANGKKASIGRDLPEQLLCARADWEECSQRYGELKIRDSLIQSICPEVYGMDLLKLVVALILCSGPTQTQSSSSLAAPLSNDFPVGDSESTMRRDSHLLLIGDPGIAKSKLLRFACMISMKSIFTTGVGSTAAGLTAAAVRDNGEWHLEAGALVIADAGICCIDEFNLMRTNDKTSIHEAMEQQTISIAKAGIVCSLSARCSILAACNFIKKRDKFEIGIESPLLSRFDLVFMLRDEHELEWDKYIADRILYNDDCSDYDDKDYEVVVKELKKKWNIKKLQLHFIAVRNIECVFTPESTDILEAYFNYCRNDTFRDPSRTTIRLFGALLRLARAHAKLLYRDKVTIIDAIIIIRIMESSYGFGRLIKPLDAIKTSLPLGPTKQHIIDICNALGLNTNKIIKSYENNLKTNNNVIKSNETTSHYFKKHNTNNDEDVDVVHTSVQHNEIKNIEKPNNSDNNNMNGLTKIVKEFKQNKEQLHHPSPIISIVDNDIDPSFSTNNIENDDDFNLINLIKERKKRLENETNIKNNNVQQKRRRSSIDLLSEMNAINNKRIKQQSNISVLNDQHFADEDDLDLILSLDNNSFIENGSQINKNNNTILNCIPTLTKTTTATTTTTDNNINFKNKSNISILAALEDDLDCMNSLDF